ncbi:histidine kinase [Algoriphagus aestuarii]|nr:histidine kinase [Algoriphagus aestuarii]
MTFYSIKSTIKKSLSNNTNDSFDKILDRIFQYPILILTVIWFLYFMLDYISVLVLKLPINYTSAGYNFLFGFLYSIFLFYYWLPQTFLFRKWRMGIITLITSTITLTLLKFYLINPDQKYFSLSFTQAWLEFSRILHFQALSILIWLFLVYYLTKKSRHNQNILFNELMIQHKSLQLNPHFVLNMLENIEVKATENSKELAEEIRQFSSVLRYSYKDMERENSLFEELEIIHSFAYCQKQRFGKKLNLKIQKFYDDKKLEVLPFPKMLLLSLFLDIFKHGDYLNSYLPCILSYRLSDAETTGRNQFSFSIFNPINVNKKPEESGFGIKTISKILEYYFGEDLFISYEMKSNEFSLLLIIDYGS